MISLYEIFHWICCNFLNFYWYFQPTVNNHAHFSPSFFFCPPFFSHLSAVSHQKDTLMVFMLCSALGPDCSGCTKHLFLFKGCFRRCKMNFLLGGNNVIICVVCLVFGRPGQQSRSLLWPINKVVITSTSLKNWPSNITCQQPENTPQLEQDNKTTSPELFQLLPPDFFNEDKDFCFSSRDPGVCVRVRVCSPGERVKKFWHHRWCKCFCFFNILALWKTDQRPVHCRQNFVPCFLRKYRRCQCLSDPQCGLPHHKSGHS